MKNPAVSYFLFLVLTGLAFSVGPSWPANGQEAAESRSVEKIETVSMTFDFGGEIDNLRGELPWREGLDGAELTREVAHQLGITVKIKGSGGTTILEQVGQTRNEGGGKDKRNWLIYLNGSLSDKGMGSIILSPTDRVDWKFIKWEDR